MPFDATTFLTGQGWEGKGKPLNRTSGARAKPVHIVQRTSLKGVGTDRERAVEWWDNLYEAAAKSIKLNVDKSDEQGAESPSATTFHRTSTGILSTYRTPTTSNTPSGASTPDGDASSSGPSSDSVAPERKVSLMARAKQDMVRRQLYAAFLRGEVVGSAVEEKEQAANAAGVAVTSPEDPKTKKKDKHRGEKRKPKEGKEKEAKRMKKDRKKEKKEKEEKEEKERGGKGKAKAVDGVADVADFGYQDGAVARVFMEAAEAAAKAARREKRRRRREEEGEKAPGKREAGIEREGEKGDGGDKVQKVVCLGNTLASEVRAQQEEVKVAEGEGRQMEKQKTKTKKRRREE